MEKNRVTVSTIAEKAGVSPATVSLALRGKSNIPAETRARILETARELGYIPRQSAIRENNSEISSIGMIMRHLPDNPQDNPFYSVVQAGIEAACRQNRINLNFASLPVDHDSRILEIPRMLIEDAVAGFLAVGLYLNETNLRIFERQTAPVVLVDAYATAGNFDAVLSMNEEGAYDAVSHLIEEGHRHIAILGTHPGAFPSIAGRRRGYERALEDHDISERYYIDSELDRQPVYDAVRAFYQHAQPVTAFFAANDWIAIGALHAFRDLDKRVPEEVSLIGFDDDLLAGHITPALTTMKVDKMSMGRIAVMLLLNRLQNPDSAQVVSHLRPTLIRRESVRRIPSIDS